MAEVRTIAEWETCTKASELLAAAHRRVHGGRPLSRVERRRKLRLLCCALARLLWDRLDEGEREAVEIGEAFADDRSNYAGRAAAREEMWRAYEPQRYEFRDPTPIERGRERRKHFRGLARVCNSPNGWLDAAANLAAHNFVYGSAVDLQYDARTGSGGGPEWMERLREAEATTANVIRDVLHCPFDRSGGEWVGPFEIRDWAEGLYRERAFDDFPVLADAVEEAGCDDASLLAHLRSERLHHRGCWAIDTLRRPFDAP